jgi:hypothetical protein
LFQLLEINLDSNYQKRVLASRAHTSAGYGHVDGREQALSCSVLEMRGAEVKALCPLNDQCHAGGLHAHEGTARPSEPHEVQAGQYGCGEVILLGVPQKD